MASMNDAVWNAGLAQIAKEQASAGESKMPWPAPTEEMLDDPKFMAIWRCIKSWDINVPGAYNGYCGATGNHARAIFVALNN
jgi:hypothetical protein